MNKINTETTNPITNVTDAAEQIIRIAKKNNCEAQVTISQSQSKEISVRKGAIEQLLSHVAHSTGIRLFKGKRSSIVSFAGDNYDNLDEKMATALESLQYLGEDENKRLLTEEEFSGTVAPLELDDEFFDDIDTEKVKETLKNIEKSGLAVSDKIIPSEMADFSASKNQMHLFSSRGLAKFYSKSIYFFSYNAVAQSDGQKEVDSWYEQKRYFSDLSPDSLGEPLENIGIKAAQRALKRLGGKKIDSGERAVVFPNRTAATILGLLAEALDGESILLRNSFLVDKLGETMFPEKITIMDDPNIHRLPGSYPFDGEGMNGLTKAVIDKGKIETYLHNSYSAGKLDMALTGNASRTVASAPGIKTGNLFLKSGAGKLEDLIREMKNGLLVEDMFTSGMNEVTGNFSFGCSGFLVENGVITSPVKEITIAGNVIDLFKNILEIADDNLYKTSISCPSILVSKLAVAGM